MSNLKKLVPIVAIETQPKASIDPYQFIELSDLSAILEENLKSTPCLEILADSSIFEIKELPCKQEDTWSSASKYTILGESRQALSFAVQDLRFFCFKINSARLSVFTDTYKDPIFLITNNFNAGHKQICCKISTSSKVQIGSIQKLCTESGSQSQVGKECFIMQNHIEDLTFRVTLNYDDESGTEILIYDIWNESSFMGNVTLGQDVLSIHTVGSLSCESKAIALGLAFYVKSI